MVGDVNRLFYQAGLPERYHHYLMSTNHRNQALSQVSNTIVLAATSIKIDINVPNIYFLGSLFIILKEVHWWLRPAESMMFLLGFRPDGVTNETHSKIIENELHM